MSPGKHFLADTSGGGGPESSEDEDTDPKPVSVENLPSGQLPRLKSTRLSLKSNEVQPITVVNVIYNSLKIKPVSNNTRRLKIQK